MYYWFRGPLRPVFSHRFSPSGYPLIDDGCAFIIGATKAFMVVVRGQWQYQIIRHRNVSYDGSVENPSSCRTFHSFVVLEFTLPAIRVSPSNPSRFQTTKTFAPTASATGLISVMSPGTNHPVCRIVAVLNPPMSFPSSTVP
jgi:hypothetical protein